ncbi:MAG: NAD-dependent DNA ligase LigA, partial [Planctomycetota bacterium]|nr:NAD-dependent DNA ligase LigA [Planctomycetota bacterium]
MARSDEETCRIKELRRLLTEANEAYYLKAEPVLSDGEFDRLLAELGQLEARRPDLADPDSPTRVVGGGTISGFKTVKHSQPMLSIDNTYSVDDVRAWYERVLKALEGVEPALCCDPKIDGVAVAIRYEQHTLELAVTRGDGVKGDDITAQVRRIASIPLQLPDDAPDRIEIRGEIFMPVDALQRVNQEREHAGDDAFANARNATAGTLKSLDTSVVSQRGLSCIVHGLGAAPVDTFSSYSEFITRSGEWGLPVSDRVRQCPSIEDAISMIESFGRERGDLPYGVDGMVLRVDRFDQQARLGATSKA